MTRGRTRLPPGDLAVPTDSILRQIYLIRGAKVMLDSALAALYGVSTKVLNQAVRRNAARFPGDFMFQLTREEVTAMRSQTVTSKPGRGGQRYLPLAFTEQGVAMLSSVLRTERAIRVNIAIMRAFVKLREVLASHKELARKLEEMERRYDAQFKMVIDVIRQLTAPSPGPPKRAIGFIAGEKRP